MNKTIYLKCGDIINTSQILNKVRGVQRVSLSLLNDKTHTSLLLNKENVQDYENENNVLEIVYEEQDVSVNTILKYYLKTCEQSNIEPCIYESKNSFIPKNKWNIKNEKLEFKTIKQVEIQLEEKEVKIARFDLREEALLVHFSNRMYYVFALLVGLGIVLLGETVFILPAIGACLKRGIDTADLLTEFDGYISLASKVLSTGLILIFLDRILKLDFKFLKNKWYFYLLFALIGFGLIFLDGLFFDFIYQKLGITVDATNEETVKNVLRGNSGVFFAISVVTLTPFVEEMVFRKLMFSTFKYCKLPRWLVVLLTTLIFALIHCTGEDFTQVNSIIYFLNYFSLSFIITLVYCISDENVFASTFLHILNNILGLFMM